MVTAIDIAKYLIYLSQHSDESCHPMDNLRLQKLLYFVQAWHLAEHGKPIFSEEIQAWTHGPVVPAIYPVYAEGIPEIPHPPQSFSANEKAAIEKVFEICKSVSTPRLRELSHREPWSKARGDQTPTESGTETIALSDIQKHFSILKEAQEANSIEKELFDKVSDRIFNDYSDTYAKLAK